MVEFISPEVPYRRVKSDFVKKMIRGSSFADRRRRAYIDDLVRIEDSIQTPASGWGYAGAMHYHQLREKYPKEWSIIYRELKPREFGEMLEHEREEAARRDVEEKREKELKQKQEAQAKSEWLALGGTP